MSKTNVVLRLDDEESIDLEHIEEIVAELEEHEPAITGLVVSLTDDFEDDLPEEWDGKRLPIENEREARAVAAAISVYEHRQSASLKEEAQRIGDRIRTDWDI